MSHPRQYEDITDHNGKWLLGTWQFNRRTPKARKAYCCDRCGQEIAKGTRHVKFVTAGLEGPGMETWRLHGECYLDEGGAMFDGVRPDWRWEG
jgi:hypothetical protein